MRVCLKKEENYSISNWSGGKTKELALYPAQAAYRDRNFIWRLSSATVDDEESTFTKLLDYDRVIMVLSGEVVLNYEGQRVCRLAELEQDRFDGAWKTTSYGKITDYNLMVRKGSEGYLDIINPSQEKEKHASTYETKKQQQTHAIYCKEGYAVVEVKAEAIGSDAGTGEKLQSVMVKAGELLVIEGEPGEKVEYSLMGEGVLIRAQIFYDDQMDELYATVIPHEKASFADFKKCVFLANVQFRGAKYVFKSLQRTWFDEELSGAIKKIERFYIPFFVMLIGIVVFASIGAANGWSMGAIGGVLIAWLLVDAIIVSPAIYMLAVPKPVAAHIKDVDKLTPYEQKVRDRELGRNERTEKLLKRYKNSGKNVGN